MIDSSPLATLAFVLVVHWGVGCAAKAPQASSMPRSSKLEPAQNVSANETVESEPPKTVGSAHGEEQASTAHVNDPPPTKMDRALEDWRNTRIEAGQRRRRPPVQKTPCILSGSAQIPWAKLHADAGGMGHDMYLSDFDVVTLELPADAEMPFKVNVDYPVHASGYMAVDSGLVETAQRIDLVKTHIWLDPGTTVRAFGPVAAQVTIERMTPSKSAPPVASRVPCSKLGVASARPDAPELEGEKSQLAGVVPLFAAAGGKGIGQLDVQLGLRVRVLQRTGGWARVTSVGAGANPSAAPFAFDAWVAEGFARPPEDDVQLVSASQVGKKPSHVSTRRLPLRLAPDPASRVIGLLAIRVPLLAGAEQGAMRRIRVSGAFGSNEGGDFWVPSADLTTGTAPWRDAG